MIVYKKMPESGVWSLSGMIDVFAAKTELCVTVSTFFKPRALSFTRSSRHV
jgi:hypothetical protein